MKKILLSLISVFVCGAFFIDADAATHVVNQAGDSGDGICDATCTLRDAVITANSTEPLDDTITFAPFLNRITLNSEIPIDTLGRLLINGSGADRLTIDGGPSSNRIFYLFSSGGSSSGLDISDVTLSGGNGGGSFANGQGGAIYVNFPSSLRLFRVHMTGNTAASGGGIANNSTGLIMFDSTISNNTATGDCGGILNNGDGMLAVNSTISGNTAGGDGGGLCHINSGSLQSVTLTDNTAFRGGGIAIRSFSGIFTVRNSIIAGNDHTGGGSPEIYRNNPPAVFTSSGYNLIGDDAGDSADTNVPIAYQPTDILDTNPQLIAIGNFGGTTPTHALQFNSPAKDAADPSGGQEFDQRGFEREAGASDIGAFEIQDNRHWYVTETADTNGVCDETCSLREAIAAAPIGGIIEFAPDLNSSTPIIVASELFIDKDISIAGRGADTVVISTDISDHRIIFSNTLLLTISGVTLAGGAAGQGGAIYANGGSLLVDGVHFLGNVATGGGGGIYFNSGFNNSTIRNSTFSQNDAPGGGFLCNGIGSSFAEQVTVVNSTFASNFAVSNGPAFSSVECGITARNITISGNTGINNGGVFVTSGGTLNIGNSIISGNTATTTNPAFLRPEISIFAGGTVTSAGNNLIGDSAGEAANTGTPISYQGSDILDTPPLLGSLQMNGGPTPTMGLMAASPAIDTGDNTKAVFPADGSPLMNDQRGFLRFLGSPVATVDIGAFEFGSAASWSSTTVAGTNVNVGVGPVTINFAGVSVPGNTTVAPIDPSFAGQVPGGFTLGVGYPAYEISTTAVFTAPLVVCIQAPAVMNLSEFNALNIFHYENGNLVDRTSSRNFTTKTVCAIVSNFSPFVVARSLAPTAANVSVSGRVISSTGRGIAKARVTITNAFTGVTHSVISNTFGYYQITEIQSGRSYMLSARHKSYRFSPRLVVVKDHITDADLIAGQGIGSGSDRK